MMPKKASFLLKLYIVACTPLEKIFFICIIVFNTTCYINGGTL